MSIDAELAEAAYQAEAIGDAFRVAAWVGPAGKESTENGLPLPSALPEIAEELGITVPADIPRLQRAWSAAIGLHILTLDDEEDRVTAKTAEQAGIPADDRLDSWVSALLTAIDGRLELTEFDDSPELCAVALEAIDGLPKGAPEGQVRQALERSVVRDYFGLDSDQDPGEEEAELAQTSSSQLPTELIAFGALDEHYAITPLGQWLRDELPGWAQPPEMFQELLGALEDKLVAAGVDPNDQEAMQQWLSENPDELLPALAEMGLDDDDVDFATMDLKDAFELPDTLPPVSLPAAAELAQQARACDAVPSDADDDIALEAWCEELYELFSDEEYLLPAGLDAEAVDAAEDFGLDFTGTGQVLGVMLFLNRGGMGLSELRETVEEMAGLDMAEARAAQEWKVWLRDYGDPVANLLERLGRLGATEHDEESAWLRPLGLYAIRERLLECGVSVRVLPPPDQMEVGELVAALESADEQEMTRLSEEWLASRDSQEATGSLLGIAALGNPMQRVVATAVASQIEPAHPECWEAVLEWDSMRPYAKMALMRIHGVQPGQDSELEPTWQDYGWALADTVTAVVEAIGEVPEEERPEHIGSVEMPEGSEAEIFDGMRRSGHPHAHEVLTVFGKYHPNTKTAKAARKAAFKAGSGTPKS